MVNINVFEFSAKVTASNSVVALPSGQPPPPPAMTLAERVLRMEIDGVIACMLVKTSNVIDGTPDSQADIIEGVSQLMSLVREKAIDCLPRVNGEVDTETLELRAGQIRKSATLAVDKFYTPGDDIVNDRASRVDFLQLMADSFFKCLRAVRSESR